MTRDLAQSQLKGKRKINFKRIRSIVLVLFAVMFLCGVGVVVYATSGMPPFDPEQLTGARTTEVLDDQGKVVASLHAEENRTEITIDKVPKDLVNAFLAIEDQEFYNHHGVNFKGIARALVVNLQEGGKSQGASTITQQLARSAFLSSEKQWVRKVQEIILAFKLESKYSKDEILTMYMNKIYFGAGAYGVQAASNTYFGKNVDKLTLAEASMIAGLPQSPSAYDPLRYMDKAKNRQKMVLNNMVTCGYITQEQADQAYNTQLKLSTKVSTGSKYGYYKDAVIDEAVEIMKGMKTIEDPDSAIYRAGLKIYTSMDSDLQSTAETLYATSSYFPSETKNGSIVQSGMVVVDHKTGEVKALMGGRKYEQVRGFNRATSAYRQPGSCIKPLTVYSPALEQGIMPFYTLDDSPLSIKVGNTVWQPKNYDGVYRGLIPMRTGVQYSINTYAVQLLEKVGIRYSFDFGNKLGLDLIDKPGTNDLALAPLALGGLTHGVTPMQMAGAYGTIGNGGVYIKPHLILKIEDANGTVIYNFKPEYKRVMSEQTAWLMNSMMQTVVQQGTGTKAQVPGVPTCGKTGTSEEYANSWFCGFTPEYACAVYMGYDRQDYSMNHIYGGSWPAPLFRELLTKAHKHGGSTSFGSMPDKIVQVSVCRISGKLPGANCGENVITEYCRADCTPQEVCDGHQQVYICQESGMLAGPYCPHPILKSMTKTDGTSSDESQVPNQVCTLHTMPTGNTAFGSQIAVCRDPRHGGTMYRANIAGANQTGGCPPQYVQYITLPAGQAPPSYCGIADHQVKNRT
ncbi:MAG: penicillin-binding protein 1A [Syntrophomonadaceae bacterium]